MICIISIAVVCARCGLNILYILSLLAVAPGRLFSMCALKSAGGFRHCACMFSDPDLV